MLPTIGLAATLLICWNVDNVVYLSADTRQSSTDGVTDTNRKLFQCGSHGLAAVAGVLGADTARSANAVNIPGSLARLCANLKDNEPDEQVELLADELYQAISTSILRSGARLSMPVLKENALRDSIEGPTGRLFAVLFTTLRPGQKPRIYVIDFQVVQHHLTLALQEYWSVDPQKPVIIPSPYDYAALGDCTGIASAALSEPLEDSNPIERIHQIYRHAVGRAECESIGEPIDIAKIDNDGAHWISKHD